MNARRCVSLTSIGLLFAFSISAQETVETVAQSDGVPTVLSNTFLAVGAVVALAAILTLVYLNNMVMESMKIKLLHEYGREVLEKVDLVPTQPWWIRWYRRLTKAVPMDQEKDVTLDHNYDGIQELDNSLPPWWLAMFYITIAFSVVYLYYAHFTDYGISSEQEYVLEMEKADRAVKAYLAAQSDVVDENNVEMLEDQEAIALGASMYAANCVACHGAAGEGGVGPNLTDDYWLHGGDVKSIFKTIKYGVPEKGMIAWQTQLRPADIHKITSYIVTLKGTNPPNAKEPQGELYEHTVSTVVDSTNIEM